MIPSKGRDPEKQEHLTPLVILAGWLGCQTKLLDRYAKLYQDIFNGCTVLRKIASPLMIVMAATTKTANAQFNNLYNVKSMEDFAKDIIREIATIPCSCILFHCFSNGGCFLWESIRGLVQTDLKYDSIKNNLCGIIFDSSPAYYSGCDELFHNAFKFCSSSDQTKIRNYIKERQISAGIDSFVTSSQKRSQDYWESMKNCDFPVQSLYICSRNDTLTPFEELYELIQYRVTTLGSDRIWCTIFENSPHCRHILTHPTQYRDIMELFLKSCLIKNANARDDEVTLENTNSTILVKEVKFPSLL